MIYTKKILFTFIIIFLLVGCKEYKVSTILKNIEINNETCKIVKQSDSHDYFHGDGEYFAKIKCSKESNLSNNWKKLPLTKPLEEVTKMANCSNECKNFYQRYKVPKITNGYYYFNDRHYKSTDKFDDTNLNNRASWNFTLALFDIDNNVIYYYEMDT